ncbi:MULTISPECIES: hypothetical protein [Neobacillus]|uniref:Uncharacterized protein n=1 Tax=Neobacillus citreus TaxID=2833578 RepID=A0A942T7Z9_9BACI|nr:hypothetical protein [Neobacillus citreus]MCH6269104.1 hypothetical protein [Neobacillus citreus]
MYSGWRDGEKIEIEVEGLTRHHRDKRGRIVIDAEQVVIRANKVIVVKEEEKDKHHDFFDDFKKFFWI